MSFYLVWLLDLKLAQRTRVLRVYTNRSRDIRGINFKPLEGNINLYLFVVQSNQFFYSFVQTRVDVVIFGEEFEKFANTADQMAVIVRRGRAFPHNRIFVDLPFLSVAKFLQPILQTRAYINTCTWQLRNIIHRYVYDLFFSLENNERFSCIELYNLSILLNGSIYDWFKPFVKISNTTLLKIIIKRKKRKLRNIY